MVFEDIVEEELRAPDIKKPMFYIDQAGLVLAGIYLDGLVKVVLSFLNSSLVKRMDG